MKKFLSMILSSAMICSTLPVSAEAITVDVTFGESGFTSSSQTMRSTHISTSNGISTITITTTDSSGSKTDSYCYGDVHTDYWYQPYVVNMTADGFVSGKSSTVYGPGDNLSVAEFTAMIANAFYGSSLALEKTKTSLYWWEPYLNALDNRDGLEGTEIGDYHSKNGSWGNQGFEPISRYDMAEMIFNLLDDQGVSQLTTAKVNEVIASLPDSIDSNYREAVAHAYHYGFLSGRSGGAFFGEDTLNRAEAAVVLSALVNSDMIKQELYRDYEGILTPEDGNTDSNTDSETEDNTDSNTDDNTNSNQEDNTDSNQDDTTEGNTDSNQEDSTDSDTEDSTDSDTEEEPEVEEPEVEEPEVDSTVYYAIDFDSDHGTLSYSVSGSSDRNPKVEAGDSVTLRIEPDEGYELLLVTMNGSPLEFNYENHEYIKFEMPEEDITLKATYREMDQFGTVLGETSNNSLLTNGLSRARWAETDILDIFVVGSEFMTMDASTGDVVLTVYDEDYAKVSTHTLKNPLDKFGGFTYGSDGNYYAVYGQNNKEESSSKEVFRVVKYDSSFQEIDSYSVNGADSTTTVPFDASSTSMMEQDGVLVVHSSRERFTAADGLNHQSQFTIILDSKTMALQNTLTSFQSNHVSHSFHQMVDFDGDKILLVDHGDAYPRSVVLHYSSDNGKTYQETNLLEIPGATGANCTGLTLGGFAAASNSYLTVVNRVDWDSVTSFSSYNMTGLDVEERDIVLLVTDPSSLTTKEVTLAEYIGTGKSGSTPQLVEISSNQYMVMWEEYSATKSDSYGVYYALVDGSGTVTQAKTLCSEDVNLSQYGSAIYYEGKVLWFVDIDSTRTLYAVEP